MGHYAVIFDMDGVLIDSEPVVMDSYRKVASKYGITFTDRDYEATIGHTDEDTVYRLWRRDLSKEEVEHIIKSAREEFRKNIKSIPVKEGVMNLIRNLREAGYLLGLGTSAPPEDTKAILSAIGVMEFFSAVVTAKDVRKAKPAPDIFLKVLEKLGTKPKNSVVIEDSPAGIKAARNAGCKSIGVIGTVGRNKLGEADLVVSSLKHLDVEAIQRLLTSNS